MISDRYSIVRLAPIVMFAVSLWLLPAAGAHATKFWKNSVTTGNWNVAGNWSASSAAGSDTGGVPVASEPTRIVNTDGVARTVTLDTNTPALGLVAIDLTGAGTAANTLSIPNNNTLTVGAMGVGGYNGITTTNGRGALTQANGTVTISSGLDLVVGWGAGSTGTYTLNGGSLLASQSEWIGSAGTGTFNQSGGTNTLIVNGVGSFFVGANAGSTGTYNLSGTGVLVSGESEYIGNSGTGIFNQTGGSNTIAGAGHNLYLGQNNGATGTYSIGNGPTLATLTVANNLSVGQVGGNGIGTLNVQGNASVSIGSQLLINDVSTVNFSGGTLRFATFSPSLGSIFNYTGGTIQLSNNRTVGTDITIETIYGTLPTIPTGKGLTIEGTGDIQSNLNITGGNLTFKNNGGPTIYQNKIATTNSRIVNVSASGSLVFQNADVLLANSGVSGTLNVTGLGSTVTMDHEFFVGYNGTGNLNISSGGSVSTTGYTQIATPGTQGVATLTGVGSSWTIGGDLTVGHGADGTLNINDGTTVSVGDELVVGVGGNLNLTGGTLRVGNFGAAHQIANLHYNYGTIQFAGNRTIGTDPYIQAYYGAIPVLNAGKNLAIEGTAILNVPLTLNGGTLRVGRLAANNTFQFLGGLLQVDGGSISNITNLNVPTNGEFRVRGAQSLVISGAAGSTITTTGTTTLGSATAVNGFGTQGNLLIGINNVTLLDANDVVFDALSYTSIGNDVNGGVINATNGLTLNFGGNIVGVGNINSTNVSTKPLINNGHIAGNTALQRITLSGYVKGVGTFDNVTTTGTFSPGLSPAIVSTTNLSLGSSGTLLMELGGTAVGSEYDQVQDGGQLTLGGILQVSLINNFTPAAGTSFDLLNWSTLSGTFSSLSLPALASGLTWNTSQLYTTGIVSVTSVGIPGDYNNNGIVDAADYTVWRDNLGKSTSLPNDDTAGVGQDDYTRWKAHFGQSAGSGSGAPTNFAIPEPATFTLFLLAASVHQLRRRRVA